MTISIYAPIDILIWGRHMKVIEIPITNELITSKSILIIQLDFDFVYRTKCVMNSYKIENNTLHLLLYNQYSTDSVISKNDIIAHISVSN